MCVHFCVFVVYFIVFGVGFYMFLTSTVNVYDKIKYIFIFASKVLTSSKEILQKKKFNIAIIGDSGDSTDIF